VRRVGVVAVTLALLAVAGASGAGDYPPCAEQVVFESLPGTIRMQHLEAEYNCCAWIEFEIDRNGYAIVIDEWERFEEGPCYCLCCFELAVEIAGLLPGTYEVGLWKHGSSCGDVFMGTWHVPVEGSAPPGIETLYIPCGETGAPEDAPSWGTIKALYR